MHYRNAGRSASTTEIGAHVAPVGSPTPAERLASIELLQTSRTGGFELDARIDCLLTGRLFVGMVAQRIYRWLDAANVGPCAETTPAFCWSDDFNASLRLVPSGFNFSTGLRDGVCWAWIQPNDDWTPAVHEQRHDHPSGSGLVVAYTTTLAMTSAVLIMRVTGKAGAGLPLT